MTSAMSFLCVVTVLLGCFQTSFAAVNYCKRFDSNSDKFGTTSVYADATSSNKIAIKIQGKPKVELDMSNGGNNEVHHIKFKVCETKTGEKRLYND